jgi:PIN domain nuclease of toxin-antitoxin system
MIGGSFLADTHIVLWSIADDPRLSQPYRDILNSNAIVYVSAASVWEIAIKRAIGKLDSPAGLHLLLPRMRFMPLSVTLEHAESVAELSPHHGDPFDRLIAAQARIEQLRLMTVDPVFAHYDVALA